jgi:hypothetical protein
MWNCWDETSSQQAAAAAAVALVAGLVRAAVLVLATTTTTTAVFGYGAFDDVRRRAKPALRRSRICMLIWAWTV